MTALSNEFFYSYFMSNPFSGVLVYSACRPKETASDHGSSADWFLYKPSYTPQKSYSAIQASSNTMNHYSIIHSHYFAKKKSKKENQSTEFICNKTPTNLQYLDKNSTRWELLENNSFQNKYWSQIVNPPLNLFWFF